MMVHAGHHLDMVYSGERGKDWKLWTTYSLGRELSVVVVAVEAAAAKVLETNQSILNTILCCLTIYIVAPN